MNVVHDVGMAKGMYGQLMQPPAPGVGHIRSVQACFSHIFHKYLADSVLSIRRISVFSREEEELLGIFYLLVCLVHPAFPAQFALDLVSEPARQVAASPVAGFCIFRREIDAAPAEVEMFELYSHELAHTAAELVDRAHHQLVLVVVYTIHEPLKFTDG